MDLREERRKKDKKMEGSFKLPSRLELKKPTKEVKPHPMAWLYKKKKLA